MINKFCLLLLFWVGVILAVPDVSAADMLTIVVGKHKETITLSVKKATPHQVFTLPSPDRLVVDIPADGQRPQVSLPSGYKGKLISRVRFGQFDPHTWRLVFDLNQTVRVLGTDTKTGRIIIDIAASGAQSQNESANAAADTPSSEKREDADESWPEAGKKGIAVADYKDESEKKHTEKYPERKPAKSAARSGHGKPVIVIDPGHGGVDPGTEGEGGTYEKNVVLAYARELRAKLLKTGRYKVVLTRDSDEIIGLRKRVEIARKAGASIFISLHADSAPEDDVRGLSVYTVSEKASDQETEALAARENKADVLTGVNLEGERDDVAGILISLAERETKNRSAMLADELVTTLDGKVRLLSNSHRFAGFAVLKAPDVPSVLVEIGFLSHPKEEKLINSKAYRDKVTSGIASGVDQYFRLEKRMGDQ